MVNEIQSIGLINPGAIHHNLSLPSLIEAALANGEGVLSATGALCVATGKYTGRSPEDKFVVDEPESHDRIAWGNVNKPFSQERFDALYRRVMAYLQGRQVYVFDGFAGADPAYELPIRVINQYAWQNAFITQLLLRPSAEQLKSHKPSFTVIAAPGFNADPELDGTRSEAFVIVNFAKRVVLIGGTHYAGEMKKSVFTVMNYLMPLAGVLPMHCSANVGADGRTALFFGLSGTGKTTLSADPARRLIGDDEHGWDDSGIFNFEGGCYAKCIGLSHEHEPQIWDAIKFGSITENVLVDPLTRIPDYSSDSITENTRAGYPVEYIPNAQIPGVGGHPSTVIFLTADAFGVMPPISKLDRAAAMYHFISGYTSKLAGTERGIIEPTATFSACFGAPFLPMPPAKYAEMLGDRLDKHGSAVYLVNTGWIGGPYGVGKRISLRHTRAMVSAALDGSLDSAAYSRDPIFNVLVPASCPGVPQETLNQRGLWADSAAYDRAAQDLAHRFAKNFASFQGMHAEIGSAGPIA
ncbi:MAG: phosphoenolpyruvate carboxykinase (ATP) [Clostridia bacterium]|nr:phosphoenolpyruvate carboxykinase (ATP) [Clostridia bacterium]